MEGGSTITQQLVRNLYIANPQDTLKRKIIEAHLANEEEDQHSKDWILTEYLNTASYGTNEGATAIGVEAAAETYYSKHARDLTLPEAAMIAGLPQAPVPVQPAAQPAGGAGPAQRGAAGDGAAGQHHRERVRRTPSARIWASTRDTSTAGSASPTSSTSSSRSSRTATA